MTVEQSDTENVIIDINELKNTLMFSATANGVKYGFEMELFEQVVKDESTWNKKGRHIIINVSKADKDKDEWWPRLTKEKSNNHQIVIDFDKWMDADDEPEEDKGMPDMDPSQM
jgi:hypothetical protein